MMNHPFEIVVSLTPRFSEVWEAQLLAKLFQQFRWGGKPLKRFTNQRHADPPS